MNESPSTVNIPVINRFDPGHLSNMFYFNEMCFFLFTNRQDIITENFVTSTRTGRIFYRLKIRAFRVFVHTELRYLKGYENLDVSQNLFPFVAPCRQLMQETLIFCDYLTSKKFK